MNGAIILAAGQGTRMKSKLPKVLHKIAGEAMLNHVLNALDEAQIEQKIIVLGHQAERIEEDLPKGIEIAYQREQLGTGHAVMQAREIIAEKVENVLVVCGDTPLLKGATLAGLLNNHVREKWAVTVLTGIVEDATGYGRIIRDREGVKAIVEEKDATLEEKQIKEINTGAYCFNKDFLVKALSKLTTDNSQGEYYLTDLIKIAVSEGKAVGAYVLEDFNEALGINNRLQLAQADREFRKRILENLMLEGVTILSPETTYIDAQVTIGQDTIIHPFTYLEGKTIIGQDCILGPHTRIIDSKIGNKVQVENSVIKESTVDDDTNIGPFAYLRPGSVLGKKVKIGDFVEIKKSVIGDGSKVPHLSYVGDAQVGKGVNIGCGTITCNYDGEKKYTTIIQDKAFIGSNTNLVAPVIVEEGAYIGAGSTITKDVPKGSLAIARGKQINIPNWNKEEKD
ncbi:MAG: bifunctional UDP-N-acetylglucosamine diphosphorylase/glucosamine-1-phosphate N-acetyltransferase GlmU [Clostridia bacterium]|jgi:bifunctional UDP-N-acetylglucosamine pyrophosphorylase/glucosamine-1-phosphate N-acetyltransferase|nr:bifunctional UDP-N-acetylglucosamine diphosphorylase/glucosamine-1-phosphate N-acetyltransferase GlmU [Clostridia bacterium]